MTGCEYEFRKGMGLFQFKQFVPKFFHLKLRKAITYLLLICFVFSLFGAGLTHAADTMPRRAVITALEGSVLVQAAGQATALPARRNMEIKSGDRIITGRDGKCEIRYDDGSVSRIGPNSRVDITNLSRAGADGPDTTIMSAQRGSVWNNAKDVVQRNSRFEVNTPAAVAGVRGTSFYTRVQPGGDTIFRTYEGLLGVGPPGPDIEPDDPDDPPPPPPPPGIPVGGGQQLGAAPDEPLPPDPDPIDFDDIGDFELTSLAEDDPDAFVDLVEEAANQGKTDFLERVSDLIEDNEDLQQNLGDKLEQVQQTTSQAPPPPPPPPPADDPAPVTHTLALAASPAGGGTVTGGGTYAAGAVRNISATPASGYEFLYWSTPAGTLADAYAASATFTMPAQNLTVTAYFNEINGAPVQAPYNLTGYRGNVGEIFTFTVTGSSTGVVWGTDLYSDDSHVATAAVHAGIVNVGETETVTVVILPGQNSYEGSTRNGIISDSWDDWPGSYIFIDPDFPYFAWGGEGTEANPYLVAMAEHLDNTRNYLDAHFKLIADVYLETYLTAGNPGYNGGAGWDPIGIYVEPFHADNVCFSGSFDGNGYEIRDLAINRPGADRVGLFSSLNNATLSNIALADINVRGSQWTGGLAGYNEGSAINNCYTTGMVEAESNVGGLIGGQSNAAITGSYSSCNVTGTGSGTGGLVGQHTSGSIINSYSSGNVSCSHDNTGGLVGLNYGSISSCHSSGNVNGENHTGGLVGQNSGSGSIINSYSSGSVSGAHYTGGLVGTNWGSGSGVRISGSYAAGNVVGSDSVGGLVGENNGEIVNSYSVGIVAGNKFVGGLMGRNLADGNISKSYAAGFVDGDDDVGGLVGYNGDTVSHSFYDENRTSQNDTGKGTPKITADMIKQETFANAPASWDFTDIWEIIEDESYPYLQWQDGMNIPYGVVPGTGTITGTVRDAVYDFGLPGNPPIVGAAIAVFATDDPTPVAETTTGGDGQYSLNVAAGPGYEVSFSAGGYEGDAETDVNVIGGQTIIINKFLDPTGFADGDGSSDYPFLIATPEHLNNVRNFLGEEHADKHYKLVADIYLDVSPWNTGAGWEPIGTDAERFWGSFDGNGHSINNLFINRSTTDYVGLFAFIQNATIYDLGLVNVDITGRSRVGGLAGLSSISTINDFYLTGKVTAGSSGGQGLVGGVVGWGGTSTTISNTYTTGIVTTTGTHAGGLVGWTYANTISRSYSTSNITGGSQYVGGLVGSATVTTSITDSYAMGNVHGSGSNVGGLVGTLEGGGTITNSYAMGSVTGGSSVGGLLGANISSTVTNSFWDTESSGEATSGGGTGKTTAEMTQQNTFVGWNFVPTTGIWAINEGTSYPFLQWQDDVNIPYAFSTTVLNLAQLNDALSNPSITTIELGNDISIAGADLLIARGVTIDGKGKELNRDSHNLIVTADAGADPVVLENLWLNCNMTIEEGASNVTLADIDFGSSSIGLTSLDDVHFSGTTKFWQDSGSHTINIAPGKGVILLENARLQIMEQWSRLIIENTDPANRAMLVGSFMQNSFIAGPGILETGSNLDVNMVNVSASVEVYGDTVFSGVHFTDDTDPLTSPNIDIKHDAVFNAASWSEDRLVKVEDEKTLTLEGFITNGSPVAILGNGKALLDEDAMVSTGVDQEPSAAGPWTSGAENLPLVTGFNLKGSLTEGQTIRLAFGRIALNAAGDWELNLGPTGQVAEGNVAVSVVEGVYGNDTLDAVLTYTVQPGKTLSTGNYNVDHLTGIATVGSQGIATGEITVWGITKQFTYWIEL